MNITKKHKLALSLIAAGIVSAGGVKKAFANDDEAAAADGEKGSCKGEHKCDQKGSCDAKHKKHKKHEKHEKKAHNKGEAKDGCNGKEKCNAE